MTNKILIVCGATLLGFSSITAQASTIELVPVGSTNIVIGESVVFEIWADFEDVGGTIGGGLDIFYDANTLKFNNDFVFNPDFGADLSISRTGDDCSASLVQGCTSVNEVNGISPNNFNGMANALTLMGNLSFTGIFGGSTELTMHDNDAPAGVWFDNSTFSRVLPDYIGTTVEVSAVPVPPAAFLFGSGLLGLISLVRRKN